MTRESFVHGLPERFLNNVTGAFSDGASWLATLPHLIADCCAKWDLLLDGDCFDLSFHYVVPVLVGKQRRAVLKLGVPAPAFAAEIHALRAFKGNGAAAVLDSDVSLGALLLERIEPGYTLASIEDDIAATQIGAKTMRRLWNTRATGTQFRSLESWTSGFSRLRARFAGTAGPLDGALVGLAESLRAHLLEDRSDPVLLHADLHHLNLLYDSRSGWVVIDPKGIFGDRCYEPASFLLNPEPSLFLNRNAQQSRIAVFAKHLDLDAKRITQWAFVHAVLAAWWVIEDGGSEWKPAMEAAAILRSLL